MKAIGFRLQKGGHVLSFGEQKTECSAARSQVVPTFKEPQDEKSVCEAGFIRAPTKLQLTDHSVFMNCRLWFDSGEER
jgi:hypothetical protein